MKKSVSSKIMKHLKSLFYERKSLPSNETEHTTNQNTIKKRRPEAAREL